MLALGLAEEEWVVVGVVCKAQASRAARDDASVGVEKELAARGLRTCSDTLSDSFGYWDKCT